MSGCGLASGENAVPPSCWACYARSIWLTICPVELMCCTAPLFFSRWGRLGPAELRASPPCEYLVLVAY